MRATTTHESNADEARGVLAALRALVPVRTVSPYEAATIIELQASRLRELLDVNGPDFPTEALTAFPYLRIVAEHDMPISGSAHWTGHVWLITVNADEHVLRQRFSTLHELRHVIDHTAKDRLYGPGAVGQRRAEWAADYFSGCVLMPRRWVKRLWGEGHQSIDDLAAIFDVSKRAMEVRLEQLGLTQRQRCTRAPRTPQTLFAPRNELRTFAQARRGIPA
jgi:hypothetical protein